MELLLYSLYKVKSSAYLLLIIDYFNILAMAIFSPQYDYCTSSNL